jgi:hypothetical protein
MWASVPRPFRTQLVIMDIPRVETLGWDMRSFQDQGIMLQVLKGPKIEALGFNPGGPGSIEEIGPEGTRDKVRFSKSRPH